MAPVEGFTNIDNVFQQLLNVRPIVHKKTKVAMSPTTSTGPPTAFLQEMIKDQRATADSLMDTAKKISPASQTISALESAYDASFESEIAAPMPSMSGTLQGFTLFFFVLSFLCLAIVVTVWTNNATGNLQISLKIFGGFIVLFFICIALIQRFA